MIRLPFTDGLVSTDRTFFPSYTAGLYEQNGSTLFVTRCQVRIFVWEQLGQQGFNGQAERLKEALRLIGHQLFSLLHAEESGASHLHSIAGDVTIVLGAEVDLRHAVLLWHPGQRGHGYQLLRRDVELFLSFPDRRLLRRLPGLDVTAGAADGPFLGSGAAEDFTVHDYQNTNASRRGGGIPAVCVEVTRLEKRSLSR